MAELNVSWQKILAEAIEKPSMIHSRIFGAADKILKAGLESKAVAS